MCILFFYINQQPQSNQYKLLLVNNRDEVYSRPTQNAHVWKTDPKIIAAVLRRTAFRASFFLFAGAISRNVLVQGIAIKARKDIEVGREGGTWLGASENGRIGCLVNVFQSKKERETPQGSGRGFLTVDFLLEKELTASEYIQNLTESANNYSPFNLVLLEMRHNQFESSFYCNKDKTIQNFEPGMVHGIGNCLISKPFNKIYKGKTEMEKIIDQYGTTEKEASLVEALFSMMKSKEQFYPDDVLRQQGTGYPDEIIQGLSSIWVNVPLINLGSRTTTVITVDANNELRYYEQTMKTPSISCTDFDICDFQMSLI